jgi:hypothetical protein
MANESSFGNIAAVTGTDYCLVTSCDLQQIKSAIQRPDITGSLTQALGVSGRYKGSWNMALSLAGNGAAGVVPAANPLLTSLFGASPTIVASTSVTYGLTDNTIGFSLYNFSKADNGTSTNGMVGMSCVPDKVSFTLGQDIASISASGNAAFVLDKSQNWANYTSQMRGGLSSFPAEPASPSQTSTAVIGFKGSILLDGQTVLDLRSAVINFVTSKFLVETSWNGVIPTGYESDLRATSLSFTIDDSDSAALADLKNASFAYSPIDALFSVGTTVGNTFNFSLKQIQLAEMKYNASARRITVEWGESGSHGTSITANDAFSLQIV